ncbi:LysM peptidoglycan-binding domain-containing protein [bacterium LRH843]|nr:LysM peptidoglycan-binding domain-containing protein [bacterium LRH843]
MHKHIVKPVETLSSIAADYRVPLSSLIQTNHITNPNMVHVGQAITIPGLRNPNEIPYQVVISLSNRTLTLDV